MMIVSPGSPLESIIEEARRFARSDATVLVTGETGTGKEVFARLVHDASPRASHAFVAVNCGAIPESLIEAELFGHVKGAFTGAHAARKGRVAMAQGGTLFLDEIGELSLPMQVKLLRLLQQRTYEPVGSSETLKADFRLVAATNRDLKTESEAGRFRSDLYYRIFVCPLHLPPLRDRGLDDLKALFFSFWAKLGDKRTVDDGVFEAMRSYPWPGNVRELENFVERLSVVSRNDVILASDVPDSYRQPVLSRRAPTMLPSTVLPSAAAPTTTLPSAAQPPTTLPSSAAAAAAAAAAAPPPEPEPAFSELSWLDALPGSVEPPSPPALVTTAVTTAAPPPVVVPVAPSPAVAPSPVSAAAPAAAVVPAAVVALAADAAVRLPIDLSAHLDAIERGYIEAALRATGGNKQASADLLGLQRTTLVAKCKKHGLEDAGKNEGEASGPAGLRVELAEDQRPLLSLRGASFRVAVIREDVVELVSVDGTPVTTTDTAPVAGSCVVDGETLRLFGALRARGDGVVLLELAIPLERAQLVNLQRNLVKRRPRAAAKAVAAAG
jgi:sigma-54 specific flagellar transcriptional regulator A